MDKYNRLRLHSTSESRVCEKVMQSKFCCGVSRNIGKNLIYRQHNYEIQSSYHVSIIVFCDFCERVWSWSEASYSPPSQENEINDLVFLMFMPPFIQQMEM